MPVSSSVLVHQTKTKESLESILRDASFFYKFCREEHSSSTEQSKIAFPMVSFTDLPISKLKFLLDKPGHYGPYGIGLRKEWAQKEGLNPVLYFDKNSIIFEWLNKVRVDLIYGKKPTTSEPNLKDPRNVLIYTINQLFSYSKNYSGPLFLNDETNPDYKFSDEKEWRSVIHAPELDRPELKGLGFQYYLNVDQPNYKEIKEDWDKKLRKCDFKLQFSQQDIEYIIVSQNSEIPYFIDLIKDKYGETKKTQILLTRLISKEQIINDF